MPQVYALAKGIVLESVITSLGQTAVHFAIKLTASVFILTVRFWSKYGDMADASADTLEQIYNELPQKKVKFPFPHMNVHITK